MLTPHNKHSFLSMSTYLLCISVLLSCLSQNNSSSRAPAGAKYYAGDEAQVLAPAPEPDLAEEPEEFNTESYDRIEDNPFRAVKLHPLSTFSIDVDTASYANIRRFINQGSLPPKDAVRIEEMINYFPYDYDPPVEGEAPFSARVEIVAAPWSATHRLARIGIKGYEIDRQERPQSNLVFLLDVSGSMSDKNKLPLLKEALSLLMEQLNENDRVAIVVYAGSSGLVLPSTPCTPAGKEKILKKFKKLKSGGSTNGGKGIELAYKVAEENFIEGGVNRVLIATDGDFNVGVTNEGDLTRLIEEKAKSNVFLSVFGFGMGNYKDSIMEKLADKGNGNYAYIDTLLEAKKVLVDQMSGTLVTIAKDVKIQVEFNPAQVEGYRLIGYENRLLNPEDFKDDKKDAGEIGAGHTVTALYEIVPAGQPLETGEVDPLKYQQPTTLSTQAKSDELLTVKIRYKQPEADTSKEISFPVKDSGKHWEDASQDFLFAASVASFGMLLRDSPYKGESSFEMAMELGKQGLGEDRSGYRKEYIQILGKASSLKR